MNSLKVNENHFIYRTTSFQNDLNKKLYTSSALNNNEAKMAYGNISNNNIMTTSLPSPNSLSSSYNSVNNGGSSFKNLNNSLSSSSLSLSSSCSSLSGSTSSLNSTWSSVLYLPSLHPHLFSEPTIAPPPPPSASSQTVNSKRETFYENFFSNLNANGTYTSFLNKNQMQNLNMLNGLANVYGHLNSDQARWLREQNFKLNQLRRVQNNFEQLDNKSSSAQYGGLESGDGGSSEFTLSYEEINRKVNDLISTPNADEIRNTQTPVISDEEREEYLNNKEVSDLNGNFSDVESNLSDSSSTTLKYIILIYLLWVLWLL
jgi:hypothetical protein